MSGKGKCDICEKEFTIKTLQKYGGKYCSACSKLIKKLAVDDNKDKKIVSPKKATISVALRKQVWFKVYADKFKGKCIICNVTEIDSFTFDCGHNIPESKGGATTVDNLYPICNGCNKSMGTTPMQEFVKKFGRDTIIKNEKKSIEEISKNINVCINSDLISKIATLIHENDTLYEKWSKKYINGNVSVSILPIMNIYIQD